jgi:hypothetical protein
VGGPARALVDQHVQRAPAETETKSRKGGGQRSAAAGELGVWPPAACTRAAAGPAGLH